MADIFLSYAREDSARADGIARALEAAGFTVFWDIQIPAGQTWADFTEAKLAASKLVLVLWTEGSVRSQWVREEARIGRDSAKLVPVMLDAVAMPFGFGEVQAASLVGWSGDGASPAWRALVASLQQALGREVTDVVTPPRMVMPPPASQPPPPAAPTYQPQPAYQPQSPVAPQSHNVPPAASQATTHGPDKRLLIGGGIAAALAAIAAIAYLGDNNGAAPVGRAPAQSMAQPSSAPAQSMTQAGPSAPMQNSLVLGGLSQNVRLAVEAAQQAAEAGVDQMNTASGPAQQGAQAATYAQSGQGGYQVTTLPNGSVAAGDIATIASGGTGAVSIANSAGFIFNGAYQEGGGNVTMQGGVTWGAASAAGFWSYSGAEFQFTGVAAVQGRAQWAGMESGSLSVSTGQGQVTYPDGSQYFGAYRTAGEGPQVQIFRHGVGALYNARGDLVEAGEFANDRLIRPQ
jgi:TIR domain